MIKKILVVLIVLLILFGPLFDEVVSIVYKIDKVNTGIIWERVPLPDEYKFGFEGRELYLSVLSPWTTHHTRSQYLGEFDEAHRANGKGVLTMPENNRYEGEFRHGCVHGQGILIMASGNRYGGQFNEGKFIKDDGKGVLIGCSDFGLYEGEFKDGQFSGKGTFILPDDGDLSQYEGEFKEGQPDGQGTLTYANGDQLHGEFQKGLLMKTDQLHGKGIWTYFSGDTYQGEFKAGRATGKGILTMSDDDRYEGEFKNDLPHGEGIWTYSDLQGLTHSYKGEFVDGQVMKDGQPDGCGIVFASQGEWKCRYEGEFRNHQFNGQGKLRCSHYADYYVYNGEFKNDKFNGNGIYDVFNIEGPVYHYKGKFRNGAPRISLWELIKWYWQRNRRLGRWF